MSCAETNSKQCARCSINIEHHMIHLKETMVGFKPIVGIQLNFTFMLHKHHNILSQSTETACDMIPRDPFYVELTEYTVNLNELPVVLVILLLTDVDSGQTYHLDLSNTHMFANGRNSCQSCAYVSWVRLF